MKLVVQRVANARVDVGEETVGAINHGLLILVCAEKGDDEEVTSYFAEKIAKLRVFADASGKTNLSIRDVNGAALAVSQFTLSADWRKGNRPGFSKAEEPSRAAQLFDLFCEGLRAAEVPVETGQFGAEMSVSLTNDGPFTLVMDSRD